MEFHGGVRFFTGQMRQAFQECTSPRRRRKDRFPTVFPFLGSDPKGTQARLVLRKMNFEWLEENAQYVADNLSRLILTIITGFLQ